MRLTGKTAIVTGGASGFGAGIVRRFQRDGARLMIADIDSEGAAQLAREMGNYATAIRVDVSDAGSVQDMAMAARDLWGHIDILVNNAGVAHPPGPLEDISEDDFDRMFHVNMKSVFRTARTVVPYMKERGRGVILNIASTAGVSPRPRLNWYNASKGWMITATKTMAIELAEHGIRVNAINPVAGETPLLKSFMGEDTPEMRKKLLDTIPLGRFSQPEDIGNAALFLCSDEASMITGVALEVDGGRCI